MNKITQELKGRIVAQYYGEKWNFWTYTVNLGVQIRQGDCSKILKPGSKYCWRLIQCLPGMKTNE